MKLLTQAMFTIHLGDVSTRLTFLRDLVVGNMSEDEEVIFISLLNAVSSAVLAMKILCVEPSELNAQEKLLKRQQP
jgi:hypothetical protein